MRRRYWMMTAGAVSAAAALIAPMGAGAAAVPNEPVGALTSATSMNTVRPGSDSTSPAEKRRVDAVSTPKLLWYKCYETAECATARVPLDYDRPTGPTTELAVLRLKATNPKKRIGTLFVNPGGPGGQGTTLAYAAHDFFSQDLLERFDILGFDPRGVGFSDKIKCFGSVRDQTLALAGMQMAFPFGAKQETRFIASAKKLGAACASNASPLAGAMSTAQAARDMDLLRRAVGDPKLSYVGFSYGTALGQYYANMFPDRVRAIAVDGVIDPVSWVGTDGTANRILDDRLRSADGAYKALHEILVRCRKAGKKHCRFAQFGDPVKQFGVLARRLQARPADIGEKITYADLVGALLGSLYDPTGFIDVDDILTTLYEATSPAGAVAAPKAAAAKRSLLQRISTRRAQVRKSQAAARSAAARKAPGWDFPYANGLDAFSGVTCTDGRHPGQAAGWPAMTAAADKRAPYFGRIWGWSSVQCARDSWRVHDPAAYTGPFNRRTSAPVLFVGNYYDPATNYRQAVSASKLLPGSRLLSSNSWGHTAYGSSACVANAVDRYLLNGILPPAGRVCVGDVQPFMPEKTTSARHVRAAADASALAAPATTATSAGAKKLPPVADRIPPSILLGTR